MKKFASIVFALLVWTLLSLGARATGPNAEDAPSSATSNRASAQELSRHWDAARTSLKHGDYRAALQSVEAILAITPDDPRAQLYRSLCERRLGSSQPHTQISPEEMAALKDRLRAEEQAQRRFTTQQQAMERDLRREQATWDEELKGLTEQAQRDARLAREHAHTEAIRRAREERAEERALAQQEAVHRARSTEAERPAEAPPREPVKEPEPSAPIAPAPPVVPEVSEEALPTPGAVELGRVVVPTELAEPPAVVSPSLVGRAKPPTGAVAINARQMSVSPDRKVAIADGDVEVVFENAILTCDHLTLFTDTKDVYAEGKVRLEEGTQVFRGEMAHYNFETKKGRFLQGTISSPPWHEHGRSVEHIAEGVYQVTPGYLTSCELEPPHFKFYGRRAIVFADERLARARNVAFFVEKVPFLYLPYLSWADRHSPFFIIPGKRKPWGEFALMGYRYELPPLPGGGEHKGALRLDWRRHFGWGTGVDHQFENQQLGKGLLKLYYNEEENRTRLRSELPKGADVNRYRVLWRHAWQPMPDTTVITDFQKYSDVDFRKELVFREEFVKDDSPESFVSLVTSDPNFTFTGLVRKRVNRFQTVTDALPQLTVDVRPQRIGLTQFFSESKFDFANLQTKTAHSDSDTDVLRWDWFQQFKYALSLLRPLEVTPRVGVRQTFYTKDNQSTREARRDLFSGQFSAGVDTSLKLFRIFPTTTNVLGLNLRALRHVLTPTVGYSYIHQPTVPNARLNFATAPAPTNQLAFGLENKLQTKRPGQDGKLQAVDLGRLLLSIPYTFHGAGNKQGGRIGDLLVDVETYPWPWMRLESDWSIPTHFVKGTRDDRITAWNLDLIMVGGNGTPKATRAPGIQAPAWKGYEPGPRGGIWMMSQGQWYLGLGHRYSQNDKTETVLQYDRQLSDKWYIGTFHRFTWKEIAGTAKRFRNVREYQYSLRRDLHDWMAELVYRVDREFGEELFLTFTLKAYPELPIEMETSYHQPKLGSQSSPFSPVRRQ